MSQSTVSAKHSEGSYFFGSVSQNSADASSSSLSSTNQPNTATDLQTLRHGSLLIGRATDSDYAAVYPILHNFPRLRLCLRPSSSPFTDRLLQICIPTECELPIRPCLKRARLQVPALELTTIPPTDVDIVVLVQTLVEARLQLEVNAKAKLHTGIHSTKEISTL